MISLMGGRLSPDEADDPNWEMSLNYNDHNCTVAPPRLRPPLRSLLGLCQPWLSGPLAMLLSTVTIVTEKGLLVVYEGCVLVRARLCVCMRKWYAWVDRYLY